MKEQQKHWGEFLPDRNKAMCQQYRAFPLPFPCPFPSLYCRSRIANKVGKNSDFYQLFALVLCFALFIIGINLFLALGEVSKTFSEETRHHRSSGYAT